MKDGDVSTVSVGEYPGLSVELDLDRWSGDSILLRLFLDDDLVCI